MLEANQLNERVEWEVVSPQVQDVESTMEKSGDESVQALVEDVASLNIEETPEAKKAKIEQAAHEAEIVAIAKSNLPFYRFTPTPEEVDAARQSEYRQDTLMKQAMDSRRADQNQQLSALKNHEALPTLKADGSVEYLNALLNNVKVDEYTKLSLAMGSLERVGLPKADVPKEAPKGVKPKAFAKATEYTGTHITPYQQLLANKQKHAELKKLSTKEGNSHHESYQKLQRNGLLDTVVDKVPLLSEAVDQAHRDQVDRKSVV